MQFCNLFRCLHFELSGITFIVKLYTLASPVSKDKNISTDNQSHFYPIDRFSDVICIFILIQEIHLLYQWKILQNQRT